jgi:hypothetical protein
VVKRPQVLRVLGSGFYIGAEIFPDEVTLRPSSMSCTGFVLNRRTPIGVSSKSHQDTRATLEIGTAGWHFSNAASKHPTFCGDSGTTFALIDFTGNHEMERRVI